MNKTKLQNATRTKLRSIWSFFSSPFSTPVARKVFPRSDRKRTTQKRETHRQATRFAVKAVGSAETNLRGTKRTVKKGAGAGEGINALQADIMASCNQLIEIYRK